MKTNPLQSQSINLIDKNINVKNEDIPTRLLEYWYFPEDVSEYSEKAETLNSYVIFIHAVETYYKTKGEKVDITPIQMMLNFSKFQIIIANILDKQPRECDCEIIDLFDFDKYNDLKIKVKFFEDEEGVEFFD